MKKIVFFIALLAAGLWCQAQTWHNIRGSFRMADIHGDTIDLQEWLDSGYSVVIDYFATWCGPCWQIHQAGCLERIYEAHGPQGTNTVRVVMVEVDAETTLESLQGTGPRTMGDWTNGGTVPFPIIDSVAAISPVQFVFSNAVPFIVYVAPNGSFCSIGPTSHHGLNAGNPAGAPDLIYSLMHSYPGCPDPLGVEEAGMAEVQVFPNPVADRLSVEAEGLQQVDLVDEKGSLCGQWRAEGGQMSIDISALPVGTYLVCIGTEKGVATRKVVKR